MADLVLIVDNVIAADAAADAADAAQGTCEHEMVLVVFGLVVGIRIIVWGSSWSSS